MLTVSLAGLCLPPAQAQKTTAKAPASAASKPSTKRYDLSTVSGLTAFVAEKRRTARKGKDGKPKGTGIYEEMLARLKERAYPNQTMDVLAIQRGIAHRDQMQPATISGASTAVAAAGAVVTGARGLSLRGGGNGLGGTSATGNWEFIGPKNLTVPYTTYYGPSNSSLTGRVSGIAFHPADPLTIYIATPIAGIHKTTDGGKTWAAIGDSFPIPFTSCVAVDFNDPNVIYAGLGDHDYGMDTNGWWFGGGYNARQFGGVMRSGDGGRTWAKVLPSVAGSDVNSIVSIPNTPGVVLAASSGSTGGIYRSADYGQTWTKASSAFSNAEDIELGAVDGTGKRSCYVVANGSSIYRSTDLGITWAQITGVPTSGTLRIAASAVDANVLYVSGTGDRTIRKGTRNTTTGAWTWTDITGNFPHNYGPGTNSNWSQVPYDYHLEVAPVSLAGGATQDVLYLGLITIAASVGANGTWIDIGRTGSSNARTHNDQHSFASFPGNPAIMAFGNDGGIYGMTLDTTSASPTVNSWGISPRWNDNIGLTAFHNADFHPTNPSIMLGGAQDNATPASLGNLTSWANPGAGDGFGSAINPSNPAIQFLTVQYGDVARTGNSWASQTYITPAYSGESPGFFTWVGIDPTAPGHFYLGTQYLWRYNETTKAWQGHLGNTQLSNDQIRAITVAPSDTNRLYVGSTDGKFWISTNQGATWTQRFGLPNRSYTNIWVNPTNPDHLRVAVGGTGTPHLYESKNGGLSFTSISGSGVTGLPDVPTNAVTADASSIWVGNDLGVFYSSDGGQTWLNATQPLGLPNCEVSTLKLVPGTSYVMAATYGRGMWRIPVTVDSNWVAKKPGVVVATTATLSGPAASPKVAVTLKNTGELGVGNVMVTNARLLIGAGPNTPPVSLPIAVGTLAGNASQGVTLSFPATNQASGTKGTFKVSGTYVRISDNTQQSFTATFTVFLP